MAEPVANEPSLVIIANRGSGAVIDASLQRVDDKFGPRFTNGAALDVDHVAFEIPPSSFRAWLVTREAKVYLGRG